MILRLIVSLLLLAFVSADDCPQGWIRTSSFSRCVMVSTFLTSFDGATDFCKAYGATLIGIHNAFENAEILALAKKAMSNATMWIGLSNENSDHYYWQDGTDLTFTNFEPGYPVEKTKSCVTMNEAGQWANRFACCQKNTAGYICVLNSATPQPLYPCEGNFVFIFDGTDNVNDLAARNGQLDAISRIVGNFTLGIRRVNMAITEFGNSDGNLYVQGFRETIEDLLDEIGIIRQAIILDKEPYALSQVVDDVSYIVCSDPDMEPTIRTSFILFSGSKSITEIDAANSVIDNWNSCSNVKTVINVIILDAGDPTALGGLTRGGGIARELKSFDDATFDTLGGEIVTASCNP